MNKRIMARASLALLPFALALSALYISSITSLWLAPLAFALWIFTFVALASFWAKRSSGVLRDGMWAKSGSSYQSYRLYGEMWSSVQALGPLYRLMMSWPLSRRMLLQAFGWKGATDIGLHARSSLQNLPLLQVETGAQIGARVVIGTQFSPSSGQQRLEICHLGAHAQLGSDVTLGLGCRIEAEARVGEQSQLGFHVHVGHGARLGSGCDVEHGVHISPGTQLGDDSYVGRRARLGSEGQTLRVPPRTVLPKDILLAEQRDLDAWMEREALSLRQKAGDLMAQVMALPRHPQI